MRPDFQVFSGAPSWLPYASRGKHHRGDAQGVIAWRCWPTRPGKPRQHSRSLLNAYERKGVPAADGGRTGVTNRAESTPPVEQGADTGRNIANLIAGNKFITIGQAAAHAGMESKLGRLSSGINPELLADDMTIASANIEAGVRKFGAYASASAMLKDMGDGVTPHLLTFWEGASKYPDLDTKSMTNVEGSARASRAADARGCRHGGRGTVAGNPLSAATCACTPHPGHCKQVQPKSCAEISPVTLVAPSYLGHVLLGHRTHEGDQA